MTTSLIKRLSSPIRANKVPLGKSLVVLFLIIIIILGWHQNLLPQPVSSSHSSEQFSAERAYQHLKNIAQKPHPTGSKENEAVANYIIHYLKSINLDVEEQKSLSVTENKGVYFAAEPHNIMTRIKGSNSTKPLLFMAHYDSVPNGAGANDNAMSVAIMLENLAVMQRNTQPLNDIFVLFTDAEEVGLLGSKLFWEEHPWSKDIGVAINLEARGSGGASLMFETSDQNGWLISEYTKAIRQPVVSSFFSSIYSMLLPNDTDLKFGKLAGVSGLNFAFGEDWHVYHTSKDSIENISLRTMQHQGNNAYDIMQHFGNIPLDETKDPNEVFFNVFNIVVHYPIAYVLPVSVVLSVILLLLLAKGIKRKTLKLKGILLSALALTAATFLSLVLIAPIWKAVELTGADRASLPSGFNYHYLLYNIAFVLIASAIYFLITSLLSTKINLYCYWCGGLLLWTIVLSAITLIFPQGSYLFAVPLLFQLIPVYLYVSGLKLNFKLMSIVHIPCILVVPVLLFSYVYRVVFVFMPVLYAAFFSALTILLLSIMIPVFKELNTKWISCFALLAACLLLAAGNLQSAPNADRPSADNIYLTYDNNDKETYWVSNFYSAENTALLMKGAQKVPIGDILPGGYQQPVFAKKSQTTPLNAPLVTKLSENTSEGKRQLTLKVESGRESRILMIEVKAEGLSKLEIGGKQLPNPSNSNDRYFIRYTGADPQVTMAFMSDKHSDITVSVTDVADGLNYFGDTEYFVRPDSIMSAGDFDLSTLSTMTYTF